MIDYTEQIKPLFKYPSNCLFCNFNMDNIENTPIYISNYCSNCKTSYFLHKHLSQTNVIIGFTIVKYFAFVLNYIDNKFEITLNGEKMELNYNSLLTVANICKKIQKYLLFL